MNSTKQKNSPQRMCIACRRMSDKKDLLRIVKSADGTVSVDETGKKSGRGAYVCINEKCIDKCAKGLLSKHLNCMIPIGIYDEIRTKISE